MKTPDIKKILKENPDAVFHASIAYQPDYVTKRPTRRHTVVVKLHIHERGHFMATEVGRVVPQEGWNVKPYRIDPRDIIKTYQEENK